MNNMHKAELNVRQHINDTRIFFYANLPLFSLNHRCRIPYSEATTRNMQFNAIQELINSITKDKSILHISTSAFHNTEFRDSSWANESSIL